MGKSGQNKVQGYRDRRKLHRNSSFIFSQAMCGREAFPALWPVCSSGIQPSCLLFTLLAMARAAEPSLGHAMSRGVLLEPWHKRRSPPGAMAWAEESCRGDGMGRGVI
eukprot:366331-Chlamydomonas_euryale.AAC.1